MPHSLLCSPTAVGHWSEQAGLGGTLRLRWCRFTAMTSGLPSEAASCSAVFPFRAHLNPYVFSIRTPGQREGTAHPEQPPSSGTSLVPPLHLPCFPVQPGTSGSEHISCYLPGSPRASKVVRLWVGLGGLRRRLGAKYLVTGLGRCTVSSSHALDRCAAVARAFCKLQMVISGQMCQGCGLGEKCLVFVCVLQGCVR